VKYLAKSLVILLVGHWHVQAQSTTSAAKFEVASIKPTKECGGGNPRNTPGRLILNCIYLKNLIATAYGRFANARLNPIWAVPKVEGGPSWIDSIAYNIEAKAQNGASRALMSGPMLQALLEERFKLKLHRETREVPVYALTVAKGGSKLKPFEEGNCIEFGKGRGRGRHPGDAANEPFRDLGFGKASRLSRSAAPDL
jgi:uncharacterized protein (TIGR03435 family)